MSPQRSDVDDNLQCSVRDGDRPPTRSLTVELSTAKHRTKPRNMTVWEVRWRLYLVSREIWLCAIERLSQLYWLLESVAVAKLITHADLRRYYYLQYSCSTNDTVMSTDSEGFQCIAKKFLPQLISKCPFCRAMLCISAAYVVMRCLCVRLCVCPSDTFVDHVKTNKRIFSFFTIG